MMLLTIHVGADHFGSNSKVILKKANKVLVDWYCVMTCLYTR